MTVADAMGHFGRFGGQFMPEALMAALTELDASRQEAMADPGFLAEFETICRNYAGTPSLLYSADRLSEALGARILLKREDLNHTGAHKTRKRLGQAFWTQRQGTPRWSADTAV